MAFGAAVSFGDSNLAILGAGWNLLHTLLHNLQREIFKNLVIPDIYKI